MKDLGQGFMVDSNLLLMALKREDKLARVIAEQAASSQNSEIEALLKKLDDVAERVERLDAMIGKADNRLASVKKSNNKKIRFEAANDFVMKMVFD